MTPGLKSAEQRVFERLAFAESAGCGVAGFYHPDDVAAARLLHASGVVDCWQGEGRDRGQLLVRRRAFPRRTPAQAPAQDGGGDAA